MQTPKKEYIKTFTAILHRSEWVREIEREKKTQVKSNYQFSFFASFHINFSKLNKFHILHSEWILILYFLFSFFWSNSCVFFITSFFWRCFFVGSSDFNHLQALLDLNSLFFGYLLCFSHSIFKVWFFFSSTYLKSFWLKVLHFLYYLLLG